MMKKLKKIMVLSLVVTMMFSLFTLTNVNAKETNNAPVVDTTTATPITNVDELKNAFINGGEYYLINNLVVNEELRTKASLVLDLNGYSLSMGMERIYVAIGNSLKIGNGTVTADGKYLFYNAAGNLTIESGMYKVANMLLYSSGKDVNNEGTNIINGGYFSTTSTSGYIVSLVQNSETYVNGGNFKAKYGFSVSNGTKATVLTSGYKYENKQYMLTDEEYNNPVKLVWGQAGSANGPIMEVDSAAIYGNFFNAETDITINSGRIISNNGTAIYHPQQGKFVMNGGFVKGATGIDAKMGDFEFNGGYVIGTAQVKDTGYEDQLGSSTADGSAIALQTEYYGGNDFDLGSRGPMTQMAVENSNYHLPRNNDLSLTIKNGVFISHNNTPLTIMDWNMCEQKVKYSITGGRFSHFPKTVTMLHGENDGYTEYEVEICNTVDSIDSYIQSGIYKFAPSAYYDGVNLAYGYEGSDAGYYASTADAIDDRNNDKDARAYIYYLLDNGLPQNGNVNRQTQIFYSADEYCLEYIPENLGMTSNEAIFEYNFIPSEVSYNENQYVLTNLEKNYALWSPAVTYDANGGTFTNGSTTTSVLATTASGLFTGDNYGYVVDQSDDQNYVTFDEKGTTLETPENTVVVNPENPTYGKRIFLGWFYEDGTEFNASETLIKENLTVFAKWSELYTVTVNYIDRETNESIQESIVIPEFNAGDNYEVNDLRHMTITVGETTYTFDSHDVELMGTVESDLIINIYYVQDEVLGDKEEPEIPVIETPQEDEVLGDKEEPQVPVVEDEVLGDTKKPDTSDMNAMNIFVVTMMIGAMGIAILKKREEL